ncbi:MAG: 23S rRNA (guanine(2445)-N(2))/(guanine(2069)-N(7))-methyltransferase, partial [Gammaproteobacteria bacterium]|nr:23S rRNA (guanine(2445)-N(2))/(guanine(2069)-N(7))-methyltransferase [Gammaproteobacteria bacterium]
MNATSEKQEHHDPVQMFTNRLQKNIKHLRRWLNRENIHCYRIYDADIPEYAFAIDVYHGKKHWIHVQEYAAPKHINEDKALTRQQATLSVIKELMEIPDEQLFFKVRRQQKGQAQYEKLADNKI